MSDGRVTLFVAAEAREFDGLMHKVDKSERLSWPVQFARRVGYGADVAILVANGPGPLLAAQAVREAAERQPLAAIVSTGFCGALDPTLAANDIFVAREIMGLGPVRVPNGQCAAATGTLISTNRVAVTATDKTDLRKAGGDAVEMEAAGVAAEAKRLSVPFYCVRVVTDTAEESLPLDFNQMRDAAGRFSRGRIVAAGLRHPGSVFPKLIQLNQRCKSASKALGEFLVDCRF